MLTNKLNNDQLESLLIISPKLITNILLYWWYNEGKLMLQHNMTELKETTGSVLRIDHTYKITSSFGVSIDGKWVLNFNIN